MTDTTDLPELPVQLRALGEAAERAVPPVSAREVVRRAAGTDLDAVVDIGTAVRRSEREKGGALPPHRVVTTRRRGSRTALAVSVAASVVAIAFGAVALRADDVPVDEIALGEPGQFAVPDDNGWAMLRGCESTGDYGIDTGNTFYGAYQFTRAHWRATANAVGLDAVGDMNPARAEPFVQDAIADALYRARGLDPWPVCDRFIEGPMVTPVVAAWLQPSRGASETIVFLEPSIDELEVAAIGQLVESVVEPDLEAGSGSTSPIRFVDKTAAYAEFLTMADDPSIPATVRVEDMPPSYRISVALSAAEIDGLRSTPGVLEVIESEDSALGFVGVPSRLAIDAIELEAPVLPSPSIGNLELGATVMADGVTALVVGGYGSVDGSVFGRLDELTEGDVIVLTALLDGDGASGRVELVRHFAVEDVLTTSYDEDAPDLDTLLAATPAPSPGSQRLVLVADVAGDPTARLVVVALPVDPNLSGYVLPED